MERRELRVPVTDLDAERVEEPDLDALPERDAEPDSGSLALGAAEGVSQYVMGRLARPVGLPEEDTDGVTERDTDTDRVPLGLPLALPESLGDPDGLRLARGEEDTELEMRAVAEGGGLRVGVASAVDVRVTDRLPVRLGLPVPLRDTE